MLLIIILCVIIVALFAAVLFLWRLWLDTDDLLGKSKIDYFALERGMDEQQENYEQQFLSMEETIESQAQSLKWKADEIVRLDHDLKILHVVAEHHADNCIPDYAPILGQSEYLTLSEHSEHPDKYVDRLISYSMENISG